jgi:hypothetical protein
MANGEHFCTEVCREGDKLITGTFCNTGFIRDEWEVDINDHGSLQEALQELYMILEEYAQSDEAMELYA